ncbi:MAG TPA: diguanylate cyclase [Spirochaetota bacterium]|nr:diguanylate cyclase [Spirochaetota bacterium]
MTEKTVENLLILQRDLALSLHGSITAKESYEKILDTLIRIDPVDSGGVYELDPANQSLRLIAHRGLRPETVRQVENYSGDQIQYRIIMEGQVLYRENISRNPLPEYFRIEDHLKALGVIPVMHEGVCIAALNIASHKADCFPDAVKAAVESVAAQLGSVIRNIRYREQIFENEKNLISLFNAIDDMVFILDSSGNILEINESVSKKLGYSIDELRMKNVLDVHPAEMRDDVAVVIGRMITGEEKSCHIPVVSKDGKYIPVETNIAPGSWSGKPAIFGITRDVSERILLEKKVRETSERLELALCGGNLGTWDWNIVTGEVVFNQRWAEMLGYTLDELVPHVNTWEKLVHPDDMPEISRVLDRHLAGLIPVYRTEHRVKAKDGSWKWILDTGRVSQRSDDGAPLRAVGIHLDITESKKNEEMLREISIRDPLTNIYNRRYIFDRLQYIISKNRRSGQVLAAAIADIDFFKKINDTFGHIAGDFILKEFAAILGLSIREYDLLGRYGGEEFIILFDGTTSVQAAEIMERIRIQVSEKLFTLRSGENASFTFSCGIADTGDFDRDEVSSDSLVELADKRLYEAKSTGRNRLVIK